MSSPFIGEIKMFGGNFAPRGFALCNGYTLPLAQNTALYALIGTTFGGDGRTSFCLPDLRGRTPLHRGSGLGLSPYNLGAQGGSELVTLTTLQIPSHAHTPQGDTTGGGVSTPATGAIWSSVPRGHPAPYTSGANTTMNPSSLGVAGGSQPHNNRSPFLGVSFIIALQGIFPSRD